MNPKGADDLLIDLTLTVTCQGTSGKKNWNNYWLQENAKKRKTMMDKWLKDPSSVGDASTSGGEVILFFLLILSHSQAPDTLFSRSQ